MVVEVYQVLVDWNDDGDFADANEDVTTRVLAAEWAIGRDYASQLIGRSIGGRLQVDLNNSSGDYNSFNAASPLSGSILPGRKVQVRRVPPLGYYGSYDGSGTMYLHVP